MGHGPARLNLGGLDKKVEELACCFYNDIKKKQRYDTGQMGTEWENGWKQEHVTLACTHIISRAGFQASELTVSNIKENICELTGYNRETLTKDRLYGISHKLYVIKDKLEQYLSRQTNELFDLEDKIILYDLTNTYFEGQMKGSSLARFGRSKEKRSDAHLVVLAVVVNCEGLLKYSNIFRGNMSDSKTLETVVTALVRQTSFSGRKPIVVMDCFD